MKSLSLWQPWASAIACGAKRIETRSRRTNYRGWLLIHAAKRRVVNELWWFDQCVEWHAALAPLFTGGRIVPIDSVLPLGAIVAICELVDCQRTEDVDRNLLNHSLSNRYGGCTERQMGNFSPGRWAWILGSVSPVNPPIPFSGARGLFTVPDDALPKEFVRYG